MKAFLGLCLLVGLVSSRPTDTKSEDASSKTSKLPIYPDEEDQGTETKGVSSKPNVTQGVSNKSEGANNSSNHGTKTSSTKTKLSTYTTKYDNVDLDEILNNDRLFRKYYDCLIGEGKCTPDGKELKELLPEALATDCSKCTEKQRAGGEKVLKHIIERRPKEWAVLEKMFDPEGVYRNRYKAEAEEKGIKLD